MPGATARTLGARHALTDAIPDLIGHVEHFRKRVVQDALNEATAAYWQHRADEFEDALPRPGDFIGNATPEDLERRRRRITAIATACRRQAGISLIGGTD